MQKVLAEKFNDLCCRLETAAALIRQVTANLDSFTCSKEQHFDASLLALLAGEQVAADAIRSQIEEELEAVMCQMSKNYTQRTRCEKLEERHAKA